VRGDRTGLPKGGPFALKIPEIRAVGINADFAGRNAVGNQGVFGERRGCYNMRCLQQFFLLGGQQRFVFGLQLGGPFGEFLPQLAVDGLFGQRVGNAGIQHKGYAQGLRPLDEDARRGIEANNGICLPQQAFG
jgi:hypothetical protein